MSYIFIGLKKTCLGVLDRGECDKYNEIGLKKGGGIEMSTTVLSIYAMLSLSFAFEYSPSPIPSSLLSSFSSMYNNVPFVFQPVGSPMDKR